MSLYNTEDSRLTLESILKDEDNYIYGLCTTLSMDSMMHTTLHVSFNATKVIKPKKQQEPLGNWWENIEDNWE